MIAFLTFGKYRRVFEKADDPVLLKGDYKIYQKTLKFPSIALCKDAFDYYGFYTKSANLSAVGDIFLLDRKYFKFLMRKYLNGGFKIEVYNLETHFPELHKEFPQGVHYFTKSLPLSDFIYEEDAEEHLKKMKNIKLTYGYYNTIETVD